MYSDIVKKCENCAEELEIVTDVAKNLVASKLYLDFYDLINNPVFIDDTQASRMIKDIQKLLLKYLNDDFTDDKKVICSIIDIFNENKIII